MRCHKIETAVSREVAEFPSAIVVVSVAAEAQKAVRTQTPLLQALFGLIGTVATGEITSLMIAIFVQREKFSI